MHDDKPDYDVAEVGAALITQTNEWVQRFVTAEANNPYAGDLMYYLWAKLTRLVAGMGRSADELAAEARQWGEMPIKLTFSSDLH